MEIVKFFKLFGKIIARAFNDIVAKANILKTNPDKFPDDNLHVLQDIIQHELDSDLHKLNGKDHKYAKTKPKQFQSYISSARTLFRMLWFTHFLEECFKLVYEDRSSSFASIASDAYTKAFGEHHGFMIRASVKTGMMMAPSR